MKKWLILICEGYEREMYADYCWIESGILCLQVDNKLGGKTAIAEFKQFIGYIDVAEYSKVMEKQPKEASSET